MNRDRKIIFSSVGETEHTDASVESPFGTITLSNYPKGKKVLPFSPVSTKVNSIPSDNFVFIGTDNERTILIVADGITNKGRHGSEASELCFAATQALWSSDLAINPETLFKYWHNVLKESPYKRGAFSAMVVVISKCVLPNTNTVATVQFYSSGSIQGRVHSPNTRLESGPLYSTSPDIKNSVDKITKAVNGKVYFEPKISPVIYCDKGDFLQCSSSGVARYAPVIDTFLDRQNRPITDILGKIQSELFFRFHEDKIQNYLMRLCGLGFT